jgi:hypothetical protein
MKESPLIDAGNNQSFLDKMNAYLFDGQKDIAGNTRIIGNAIDIGAYEYDPANTGIPFHLTIVDGLSVWTQPNKLFLRSEKPVRINVYTLSGIQINTLEMRAFETTLLPLSRGIYIVVPDTGQSRKVIVMSITRRS